MRHSGGVVAVNQGLEVIFCERCRFAHLWPFPEAVDYGKGFYGGGSWFCKEEAEQGYWEREYRERLRIVETLHTPPAPRSLLDIGCGAGFFLKYAQDRGWEVLGVEPAEQAKPWHVANGVPVVHGHFPSVDVRGEWDFVHLKQVLEHALYPVPFLRAVRGHLGEQGVLCVEVPNEFNPLQQALRRRHGDWFVSREHINYFTLGTLRDLLLRCGFRLVLHQATFPMELWALSGLLQYIGSQTDGLRAHRARMKFECSLGENDIIALRRGWAEAGVGREIVLWAKRSE